MRNPIPTTFTIALGLVVAPGAHALQGVIPVIQHVAPTAPAADFGQLVVVQGHEIYGTDSNR